MEHYQVIGAGGIGCAVGYALLTAGARVTFVDANPDKIKWARAHGVSVDKRPPLSAEFQVFEEWIPDGSQTILLCTKCYNNAAVLARLPVQASLIPIQNGFDRVLETRGDPHEGIASFVSECLPGKTLTRITRAGHLHLGGRGTTSIHAGSIQRLAASLQQARLFRVKIVTDILPYKHSKLMYNAAIGPLAAAAGLDNGQLLSVPIARRLFFVLLRENYTILRSAGIPLGKIGPFHPDTVQQILRSRVIARALSWAFYPSLRGTYCSMNNDLPAGQTEIDYYNGYLIELAGGRPCPLNRAVYDLIKRMERERSAPSARQLQELEALT